MFLDILLNIFLAFMLVSLFNLVRYTLKIRKVVKMNKDNPNVKGITIVNGEIKVIEDQLIPPLQDTPQNTVVDPACGKEITKEDAYRILKNGKEYFFCSWECREKFLTEAK